MNNGKRSEMGLFKTISVVIVGLAITACTPDQVNSGAEDSSALAAQEAAKAKFQELVDKREMPGAILVIEKDGRKVADFTVGYRDVEKAEELKKEDIFRLYSMSKPITSLAIIMLVDQGKIALDDPVEKYLPALADMQVFQSGTLADMVTVPARRSITIHDLLTHTSGIPYHFTGNTPVHQYYRKHGVMRDTPVGRTANDGPPARNLGELIDRIGNAPLLYQPGEQFEYSYSTTVLGAVVEAVSGDRLDVFLKQNIFEPLQMKHTGFFIKDDVLEHFVTGYAASDAGLTAIEQPESSDYRDFGRLLDGGGALAGTAEDYLHFIRLLAQGGIYDGQRLVSQDLLEKMFVPYTEITGWGAYPIKFGYGFAVGDQNSEADGMLPDGAVSWSGSGNTYFFVDPNTQTSALLMTHVLAFGEYQQRTTHFRSLVHQFARDLTSR